MQKQLNDPLLIERIITKFEKFLIPSNPEQISPRIPKFIEMLNFQTCSTTLSYHQQVENLLQKFVEDLNHSYLDEKQVQYKNQISFVGRLSKSLRKISKRSTHKSITVEKGLTIFTIIHCFLQQSQQQISYSLKDTLLIFLNKFQKLIQQQANKKNLKSLRKIQQSLNSSSVRNKSIGRFRQFMFNSNKSIQSNNNSMQSTNLSNIRPFKSQQNIYRGCREFEETEQPKNFNQKALSQVVEADNERRQNQTKQLILFQTIIKPYSSYLKKLVGLSEYYNQLKSKASSLSVAQLWIPVNLITSITNVTLNFTKIGRYYMVQYGESIVMMSELFCKDVVWIYGKIFKTLEKNIYQVQNSVRIINQNFKGLLKKDQQNIINSSGLEQGGQHLQLSVFDINLKKQFNRVLLRYPQLLERADQIHKILQEVDKQNEGLLQLFLCRYFQPKIKYMKFPQLFQNSKYQYPLIYQLQKIWSENTKKTIWLTESKFKNKNTLINISQSTKLPNDQQRQSENNYIIQIKQSMTPTNKRKMKQFENFVWIQTHQHNESEQKGQYKSSI